MKKINPAVLTVLCVMTLCFAVGCRKEEKPRRAPAPVPVAVSPAEPGSVPRQIAVIGMVKAFASVDLVARVSGYLVERNFQDGQFVKKGSVLYRIEPYQYEAAVKVAEGNLGVAVSGRKNAEITMARQKELVQRNATSVQDYDNALASKIEADSNVKVMQGQLEQAQLNLVYTRILAPFDGWMGLNKYDVGNLVGPGSGVLSSIVDRSKVLVQFAPSDSDLRAIGEHLGSPKRFSGLSVRLFFENGEQYPEIGAVVRSDNRIDSSTGTASLLALFPNPDGKLTPGQFVTLSVLASEKDELLLIPKFAVLSDQRGSYVWVAGAGNRAERRDLTVSLEFDKFSAVSKGIEKGELVILDNLTKMRATRPVAVRNSVEFKKELAELTGGKALAIPAYSPRDSYLGESDMYGPGISEKILESSKTAGEDLDKEFRTPEPKPKGAKDPTGVQTGPE